MKNALPSAVSCDQAIPNRIPFIIHLKQVHHPNATSPAPMQLLQKEGRLVIHADSTAAHLYTGKEYLDVSQNVYNVENTGKT